MNEERRRTIDNALATAQAMLDAVVTELRLEDEENGRVSGVHGEHHVGNDAERRADPPGRSGDATRGRGSLASVVVGGADAEAGAGGADVAGRGAGRPPRNLPAAASHLIEGEHYRVMDGTHNGSDGLLVPGSIEVSGFDKVTAEIATPGGTTRCRAGDLARVE